jgi:hypothetical protein
MMKMSVVLKLLRMLRAKKKLWMSPLFLIVIALGALTPKTTQDDLPFIYELF